MSNKVTYYVDLIKRYGIWKCICRFGGNIIYFMWSPIYKYFLLRFSKIDENKVVFSSTPSFSDNSKAMYEFLLKKDIEQKLTFVWLLDLNDVIPEVEDNKTFFVWNRVYYHSGKPMKTLKEIATSKYLFFTHESPIKELRKREGQIVVNLWHGCGYKDIQKNKKPWSEENPFDFALVPGNVFIETKAKFWGCDKNKIVTIGYPRYDLLNCVSKSAMEFAYNLCGYAKKIIVWMPTFRKTRKGQFPEAKIHRNFELPILNSEKELEDLNRYCKEHNICICIKRHPYQVVYECESKHYSNICFICNDDLVKKKVDLYSFLYCTDALISDYSSVAIDYLLLNKPIAFALDDFEEYKSSRGFVFEDPLKYMPGHYLYDYEDVIAFINDVAEGIDRYREQRALVMPEVHNPCDNYCERVWKMIQNNIE